MVESCCGRVTVRHTLPGHLLPSGHQLLDGGGEGPAAAFRPVFQHHCVTWCGVLQGRGRGVCVDVFLTAVNAGKQKRQPSEKPASLLGCCMLDSRWGALCTRASWYFALGLVQLHHTGFLHT
jgi:hypothetical protein